MGLEQDDSHYKEHFEFNFYYDCDGLDKDTVSRAVQSLTEKYYRPAPELPATPDNKDLSLDGFGLISLPNEEDLKQMLAATMQDPAYTITQALIESKPKLTASPSPLARFSILGGQATLPKDPIDDGGMPSPNRFDNHS